MLFTSGLASGPWWSGYFIAYRSLDYIPGGVVSLLGLGTFAIYLVDRYRSNVPQPMLPTTDHAGDAVSPPAAPVSRLALPSVQPATVIAAPRAPISSFAFALTSLI